MNRRDIEERVVTDMYRPMEPWTHWCRIWYALSILHSANIGRWKEWVSTWQAIGYKYASEERHKKMLVEQTRKRAGMEWVKTLYRVGYGYVRERQQRKGSGDLCTVVLLKDRRGNWLPKECIKMIDERWLKRVAPFPVDEIAPICEERCKAYTSGVKYADDPVVARSAIYLSSKEAHKSIQTKYGRNSIQHKIAGTVGLCWNGPGWYVFYTADEDHDNDDYVMCSVMCSVHDAIESCKYTIRHNAQTLKQYRALAKRVP
jgi:hypothetical protein